MPVLEKKASAMGQENRVVTVLAGVRNGQIVFHRPGEEEIVDAEFREA